MTAKLKNYTTSIPAERSVGDIQSLLVKFGAEKIQIEAAGGRITGLSFAKEVKGDMLFFRIPAHPERAAEFLWNDYHHGTARGRKSRSDFTEQGYNVAWRIVHDWIHAQLSIIELGMVETEEVFLPYLLTAVDRTVYDMYQEGRMQGMLMGRTET